VAASKTAIIRDPHFLVACPARPYPCTELKQTLLTRPTMASAQLEESLKNQIIETLNLEDISPADIDSEAALFGDGLGLDSIDALELIVLMDKEYKVKLDDPKRGKEVFYSVRTMADYIEANRT
jgi:acyl carrier protein